MVAENGSWGRRFANVFALIIVLPFVAYTSVCLFHGFRPFARDAYSALMSFAQWLGVSFIAVLIGGAIMFSRTRLGWIVGVVAAVFFGLITGTPASSTTAQRPIQSTAKPEARENIVNAISEKLPPGRENLKVDQPTIDAIESYYQKHFESAIKQLYGADPRVAKVLTVTVSTAEINESGHVLYMTQVFPQLESKPWKEAGSMRVLWNYDRGYLKRVQCVEHEEVIAWRVGACGKKIAESFGWDGWETKY